MQKPPVIFKKHVFVGKRSLGGLSANHDFWVVLLSDNTLVRCQRVTKYSVKFKRKTQNIISKIYINVV